MRFVFDIDGTICTNEENCNYMAAKPYQEVIDFINGLYDDGHYIIFFTARGMGTAGGVISRAYSQWYTLTAAQLNSWGVKYHELQLGKPYADAFIDDLAFQVKNDGSSIEDLKNFIKGKING